MKIVVTGGAGFVGSNLAIRLVSLGHDVVVLDDYSLGKARNLEPVAKDITMVHGDIRDAPTVINACAGADIIFNEAAASSSPMFMKDLNHAVSVNVNGFINILNAAREHNVKRVVYASSSVVYGNRPETLREELVLQPSNFYSATKLMNEHLAALFGQEYGLETVGLRYMSIYGPREETKGGYANLVSQFLWSMRKGEQPVIYGNGEQTRDFTYVKDAVEANILAMNSHRKMIGEIFNVGTGRSWSLNTLVQTLNRFLKTNVTARYIEMPVKNYMASQRADLTKIRAALGYEPRYSLDDGIADLLATPS